jgi:hypothetical protein
LFPDKSKHATGTRWAVKAVEAATTLLREIWQERNDRIHSKENALSLSDQYIRQWVTDFYANKEALIVTEEERERLFDVSLEERLQMNPNLLVLWLQTVQPISNRQLPYWLRQTTARLSLYKFFNRVRPPEPDEASLHDREEDDDFTPTDTA